MVKAFSVELVVEITRRNGKKLESEYYYPIYAHSVEEVTERYQVGERSPKYYGIIKKVNIHEVEKNEAEKENRRIAETLISLKR